MRPLIDPHDGDIEDDAASTKQRSMVSLFGSVLAEISLPKLVLAWLVLVVVPAILLGLAPIGISLWLRTVSTKVLSPVYAIVPTLVLLLLVGLTWVGRRPFLRLAESSFWSLHSVVVQPVYTMFREALRHVVYRVFSPRSDAGARAATLVAGLLVCGLAAVVLVIAWPASHWNGDMVGSATPRALALVALANSCVLVAAYLAAAALIWGVADAIVAQPRDLTTFEMPVDGRRIWRVAHLSDVHIVGERYGFRIESGRLGPRGNERFTAVLGALEAIDATEPLDVILITGDMTDAGRSGEWSEFLDAVADHPRLAGRVLLLPGNHDVNIVDRANPARFELPTSPMKRLRQLRLLSAMSALHGERVRVVDEAGRRVGGTLADALAPHLPTITAFADAGRPRLSRELTELWATAFPLVWPPDPVNGLGILLLNSNADAHFSFTNALGMMAADQVTRMRIAVEEYPDARWIVALHHHIIEYPHPASALSERVGTALINGYWFIRRLNPMAHRVVVMHGHRHIDWVGRCGELLIVSAPSPVMEAMNDQPTAFYIHSLSVGTNDRLTLLPPRRVTVPGRAGEAPRE